MADKSLALLAMQKNKPSKKQAQEIIKTLYNANPELGSELAKLYKYFMPAKPKNPKSTFDWVAQAAAGKDEIRTYLQYVCCDEEYLVAADGHRLHAMPADREPGFYIPSNEDRLPDEMKYPDWRRTIPKNHPTKLDPQNMGATLEEVNNNKTELPVYRIPTATGEDLGVNAKYLDQALNAPGEEAEAVWINGPRDGLYVTYNSGAFALVMPIRLA